MFDVEAWWKQLCQGTSRPLQVSLPYKERGRGEGGREHVPAMNGWMEVCVFQLWGITCSLLSQPRCFGVVRPDGGEGWRGDGEKGGKFWRISVQLIGGPCRINAWALEARAGLGSRCANEAVTGQSIRLS